MNKQKLRYFLSAGTLLFSFSCGSVYAAASPLSKCNTTFSVSTKFNKKVVGVHVEGPDSAHDVHSSDNDVSPAHGFTWTPDNCPVGVYTLKSTTPKDPGTYYTVDDNTGITLSQDDRGIKFVIQNEPAHAGKPKVINNPDGSTTTLYILQVQSKK